MTPTRATPLRQAERRAGLLFCLPWLLGFLLFTAGPILTSIGLSFAWYDVLNRPAFVGLENYTRLLTGDPLFWKSLANTLYITVVGVPLGVLTGLSLAMLLNLNVRGLTWYRTIYYLPSIVPVVASSILWTWILNPQFGLLNAALQGMGINGPSWLASETWAKPGIILMGLWGSGSTMLIYLAGLKGIPRHLYESAEVDGANRWRRFIHITIPMLTPTLFFTTTMGIIGSFQVFTQAYVMTGGGPVDSTLFYVYYLFNNAFGYLRMGYASAQAWVLFVIILAVTLLQLKMARHWVYYEVEAR
ncbi:MAG: sugar ABC transporter permease [Candidatus Latescibacteria bacterium]|nr:sugar ABC transporter permease [Candidatus Latescibacterota bacterium]